ncbi:MAG: DUF4952 domain-containing protein [Cyanosarcina radialis HA8281-LM2]|jgi:hypothetical protein|nr:DUF4952 domain-containing protein [Cyanosarcina radialis HA8281-LM2]
MQRLSQNLIIFLLAIASTSCTARTAIVVSSAPSPATPVCEDFLGKWDKKPKELQFSSCKKMKNPQTESLVASYSVKGKDAAQVESFLRQNFKMEPLKFLCCGWEPTTAVDKPNLPRYGGYRDRDGYKYEISMYSEETLVNNRQHWNRIPKFNVRVTRYLQEP